jgi:single-stranded DNA-binding protein
MRSVNKVILIGNVTRDAGLRHTQNGKAVSSIRLATNRTIKGRPRHEIGCT